MVGFLGSLGLGSLGWGWAAWGGVGDPGTPLGMGSCLGLGSLGLGLGSLGLTSWG